MSSKVTKLLIMLYISIELISFLNYNIFTLFNNINVFLTFGIFMIIYMINFNKFKSNTIILLIFNVILMMMTLLLTNGNIGSIVTMLNLLIGVEIFTTIKFNKKEKNIILVLILILFILFCIKSKNAYYMAMYYKSSSFNSNTVGQIIVYCSLILSITLNNIKHKKLRTTLVLIINIIALMCTINCQSRGSALGIVAFLALYFFNKLFKKSKTLYKIILILIIIGTIFPLIYVEMYKNNIIFEIPFINKSLYTGRENIWYAVIEGFKSETGSILFGLGSNFQIVGRETLNVHNMYWGIIVNFGVMPFIFIILFFKQIIYNKCKIKNIVALFPTVINGYVETAILWPSTLIFIILLINTMQANDISEEQRR